MLLPKPDPGGSHPAILKSRSLSTGESTPAREPWAVAARPSQLLRSGFFSLTYPTSTRWKLANAVPMPIIYRRCRARPACLVRILRWQAIVTLSCLTCFNYSALNSGAKKRPVWDITFLKPSGLHQMPQYHSPRMKSEMRRMSRMATAWSASPSSSEKSRRGAMRPPFHTRAFAL